MKTVKHVVLATFGASLLASFSAWAGPHQTEVNNAVQDAARLSATGEIFLVLDEDSGVATLSGQLDSYIGRSQAERTALESEYVDEVINLITVSH